MPKFYMIFAPKIFLFGGHLLPPPISYTYSYNSLTFLSENGDTIDHSQNYDTYCHGRHCIYLLYEYIILYCFDVVWQ